MMIDQPLLLLINLYTKYQKSDTKYNTDCTEKKDGGGGGGGGDCQQLPSPVAWYFDVLMDVGSGGCCMCDMICTSLGSIVPTFTTINLNREPLISAGIIVW